MVLHNLEVKHFRFYWLKYNRTINIEMKRDTVNRAVIHSVKKKKHLGEMLKKNLGINIFCTKSGGTAWIFKLKKKNVVLGCWHYYPTQDF